MTTTALSGTRPAWQPTLEHQPLFIESRADAAHLTRCRDSDVRRACPTVLADMLVRDERSLVVMIGPAGVGPPRRAGV
jgi:hypothetical protein